MSEQNIEQADAPESAVEESTSQTQPQQPEFDKDKFFRGAYNEGKSKVEKDVVSKFSELLGDNVESLEDAFSRIQQTIQPKQEEKGESEKLRELLQQYQQEAESAKEQLQMTQMQSKIDSEFGGALNALQQDNELTLKPD